jgi:uncharacterized membrane protein
VKNRLVKVICWRILSIMVTFSLLFGLTGDIKSSTTVTVLLHCFLTVAHFGFETIWEKIGESR